MPCTKELVLLMKSPRQMGLILEVSHRCRDLQLARTCARVHAPFFFFILPHLPLLLSVAPRSLSLHLLTPSTRRPSLSLSFSLQLSLVYSFYPSSSSLALVFYSYKDLAEASRLSGQNKPAPCPPPHLPNPCLTTTTTTPPPPPVPLYPLPVLSLLVFFFL